MSRHSDPSRDQRIRDLAAAGHTNTFIAAAVDFSLSGVKSARRRLGLPPAPYASQRPTHQQLLAAAIRTDGTHQLWTGDRPLINHTPVTHLAWTLHHGTPPTGHVRVTCDQPNCIAPAHLEDATTRTRHRAALRLITGRRAVPEHCRRGHAGTVRLDPDGHPHCATCDRDDKRRGRQQAAA